MDTNAHQFPAVAGNRQLGRFGGNREERQGARSSGLRGNVVASVWAQKSEWGVSENNRKAKFYSLTASGKK